MNELNVVEYQLDDYNHNEKIDLGILIQIYHHIPIKIFQEFEIVQLYQILLIHQEN